MILNIRAAELEAMAMGSAYAVLNTRIPGNARLNSMAARSQRAMLADTTITTNIRVTVRLLKNDPDRNRSV